MTRSRRSRKWSIPYDEASPLLQWLNFNPVMAYLRWRYAEKHRHPIDPGFTQAAWTRYLKTIGCVTPTAFLRFLWGMTVTRNYIRLLDWQRERSSG